VTGAQAERRVKFVGLRAERIVFPEAKSDVGKIDILAGEDPPTPRRWLVVEPNTIVQGNEVVGDNFLVDFGIKPKPVSPDLGNLKVAGNMFIKGKLFMLDPSGWLALDDMIRARMPDVHVGAGKVDFNPTPGVANQNATGPVEEVITSSVDTAEATQPVLILTGCVFRSKTDHNKWYTDTDTNAIMRITLDSPALVRTGPGAYKLTFTWTVGPYTNRGGAATNQDLMLQSLSYSWVVVLKPKAT